MVNKMHIKKKWIGKVTGMYLVVHLLLLSAHQYLHVHDQTHCSNQHSSPKNKEASTDCLACRMLASMFLDVKIQTTPYEAIIVPIKTIYLYFLHPKPFKNKAFIRGPPE